MRRSRPQQVFVLLSAALPKSVLLLVPSAKACHALITDIRRVAHQSLLLQRYARHRGRTSTPAGALRLDKHTALSFAPLWSDTPSNTRRCWRRQGDQCIGAEQDELTVQTTPVALLKPYAVGLATTSVQQTVVIQQNHTQAGLCQTLTHHPLNPCDS